MLRAVFSIICVVVTCFGCGVGIVFAKPPIEYAYAQWVEHWSTAERLCQCAGC